MSRIHVYQPFHSLTDILDCSRHLHTNRADATAREKSGELVRFDLKGNEFVERGGVGLNSKRLRPSPPPGLSPRIVFDAAAAAADFDHAAAPDDLCIRAKVENVGADILRLAKVTYDDIDVWFNTPRGKPVVALLRHQRSQIVAKCKEFLVLRRGGLLFAKIKEFNPQVVAHVTTDDIFREVRQEARDAQKILKEIWPHVFMQFSAATSDPRDRGARFMPHLSSTPPDELPAAITYSTIRAYLREHEWSLEWSCPSCLHKFRADTVAVLLDLIARKGSACCQSQYDPLREQSTRGA
jgi:hypothetical protein